MSEEMITFENEREVKMVEFDIELDVELREKLLEVARREILDDEAALLNWVIVKFLTDMTESDEHETLD